jgi:hypothetical protein
MVEDEEMRRRKRHQRDSEKSPRGRNCGAAGENFFLGEDLPKDNLSSYRREI